MYMLSYITARPLQEGDLTAQKVADSRYAESLLADCPECSISLNQLCIYPIFEKCISETFVTVFLFLNNMYSSCFAMISNMQSLPWQTVLSAPFVSKCYLSPRTLSNPCKCLSRTLVNDTRGILDPHFQASALSSHVHYILTHFFGLQGLDA